MSGGLISEGNILEITKSGNYYAGNSVEGKPEEVGTGTGTGGFLSVWYGNNGNYLYRFTRNTTMEEYEYRCNGGSIVSGGWTKKQNAS